MYHVEILQVKGSRSGLFISGMAAEFPIIGKGVDVFNYEGFMIFSSSVVISTKNENNIYAFTTFNSSYLMNVLKAPKIENIYRQIA